MVKSSRARLNVKRAPNQNKALQRATNARDEEHVLFKEEEKGVPVQPDGDGQVANEPEVSDQVIAPLDIGKPLCTRLHVVSLLNKTKEKLIFESDRGAVIVTDLYGVQHGRRVVFNGTPDEFRKTKLDIKSGDEVFIVRPLTRGRKVFFARVVAVEKTRHVICDVEDREFFHNAGKRKYGQTPYLIIPANMVFKSTKAVEDYAKALMSDLEISKTQQRSIHQANSRMPARSR